jgi:hypothetical protein
MTRIAITDLKFIEDALDLKGPIEEMLWEELDQPHAWESVGQIAAQLESASCAAGSWSDMIYTRDILDKLSDPQWVQDIEDAVSEYEDATGEAPIFDPYGSGFSLSAVVTFAVDWVAYRLASRLRSLDHVAVVVAASDSCDPHPDVIAFDTYWEAQDWVSEEIERRVQHMVDHSPHPVTEDDRTQWAEVEAQLFTITDERL